MLMTLSGTVRAEALATVATVATVVLVVLVVLCDDGWLAMVDIKYVYEAFFKWLHTMEYYQTVQFFAPWIQAWALTALIVQLEAAFVAASLHVVDTLADVVP